MLISCWHDKHPLTCDNDNPDSWGTVGFDNRRPTRSPPASPARHAAYRHSRPDRHVQHIPPQGSVTVTKYGSDPFQSATARLTGRTAILPAVQHCVVDEPE